MISNGQAAEAAELWLQRAEARPRSAIDMQLYATQALLAAGQAVQAESIARRLSGLDLNDQQRDLVGLVLAEIARDNKQWRQAQAYLTLNLNGLPQWVAERALRLQAEVYLNNDESLAAARAMSDLIDLNPSRSLAVQAELMDTLGALSDQHLGEALGSSGNSASFNGWLELMAGLSPSLLAGDSIDDYLQLWRWQHPDHPAHNALLDEMIERYAAVNDPVTEIVVLLPQNGRLSSAAKAIEDGLIQSWYEIAPPRPALQFVDSSDPIGIEYLYSQAVASGASHIIGPLERTQVAQLAASGSLDVPTLALNEATESAINLYQFALSPEQEARSVADRAWSDGHTRALVIAPSGEWGDRLYLAFKEQFEKLGGHVVYDASLAETENDFSQPLRRLLGLDRSEQRHRDIERILRQPVAFEPQIRPDADFVFLAARPDMARLVRPQLLFHNAQDLPVYATSNVYSGIQDPDSNRDMDGIVFCDAPWMLADRATIESNPFASSDGPSARLYALGRDAMRVVPLLALLSRHGAINGATGELSIGDDQRLSRRLSCAQFVGGRPRRLDDA
ncbi:MAG: penicillin-binding protein activator [Lysobacteraceae bacterium]|nr:MAG: penicillin-binding protein activator [Xanthomonadaceae bacterium]